MKIKVSYLGYGNEVDTLFEQEVNVIESNMAVLHSRMNEHIVDKDIKEPDFDGVPFEVDGNGNNIYRIKDMLHDPVISDIIKKLESGEISLS